MTVCLTFDDGLKDHATIVGPELARRGWSGAFNVPTRLMQNVELTSDQTRDLCLEGNVSQRMNWDDVKNLLSMGHEVYPHTVDHRDLLAMQRSGDWAGVEQQIAGAIDDFKAHTGVSPKFFCSPHNSMTDEIAAIIHKHGAEPYSTPRENFGWGNLPGAQNSISAYFNWRYELGYSHTDIMVHGIVKEHGGWRPFESREQFVKFLDEIAELERAGRIAVVPYSAAHHRRSCLGHLLLRIVGRLRRDIFQLIYHGRLTYEFPPKQEAFWLK